jgi:hypothetical protein
MATLGNKTKFYLTTAGGNGTFTWLVGEQNHSFNETADMIDVSDKSTDWRQYIYGQKGATADVTVFADDDSQKALLDALRQGQTVYCFSGELDATGKTPVRGRLFEALVGSIGDTFDMGAVASRSISLTVTGAPEFYPKAS